MSALPRLPLSRLPRLPLSRLPRLPLSRELLRRYRVEARKRSQAGQVGAHLVRRRGQSLELRDLAPYLAGDDVRHIDWQASARHGLEHELLVRQYDAEEALDLLISIDNRPSMAYPSSAPKLQIACWLAQAVTVIATTWGDRVRLHRLLGDPQGSRSAGQEHLVRSEQAAVHFLERLVAEPSQESSGLNLTRIGRLLAPASVWLILSDLYFADRGLLARAISRARQGLCWVIVYDLDSWPSELGGLGHGPRRILGPGAVHDGQEVEVDPRAIAAVEQAIQQHKERLLAGGLRRGLDLVHWPWPAVQRPDPAQLFRDRFRDDQVLRRLFRRQR